MKKHFLFLCAGMGEYIQAKSFAFYLLKKSQHVSFLVSGSLKKITEADNFNYKIIKKESHKVINQLKPDFLFLCNSKTVFQMLSKKPDVRYILSLDSNWLFVSIPKSFPIIKFCDYYIAVMPKQVFQSGLIENDGHYKIPQTIKQKIIPCGFIPSGNEFSDKQKNLCRKKFTKSNEKMVFVYFGRGLTFKKYGSRYIDKFFQAIKEINKKEIKVRVIYAGEAIKYQFAWLNYISWFKTEKEFELTLASSDLIVQHHGLGNLPKAIRARVPAITFIPNVSKNIYHSPAFEIQSFVKNNLCASLTDKDSIDEIKNCIKKYLFNEKLKNKMRDSQQKLFIKGEKNLYKFIQNFKD